MRRREDLREFTDHLSYLATENYQKLGEPGEYFSNCNDTFLLLGAIIEEVTGGVYRDYVTENILSPLQMNRSTFNIDELRQTVNVSTPYIYDSEKEQLRPVQWPQLGNYEVGGGICSTVIDLMKYGQFYLNEYPQTLELSILMQKE